MHDSSFRAQPVKQPCRRLKRAPAASIVGEATSDEEPEEESGKNTTAVELDVGEGGRGGQLEPRG